MFVSFWKRKKKVLIQGRWQSVSFEQKTQKRDKSSYEIKGKFGW